MSKVISNEDWAGRCGDDDKVVGLSVVGKTHGSLDDARWLDMGAFGHDEAGGSSR